MPVNQISKTAILATFGLALTLSCSSREDGGVCCSDKGNDIKNYETVEIGGQVWMAENLNYAVEGSKCYGEDGEVSILVGEKVKDVTLSKAEIQANCNKYGRLYDYETAMKSCPQGWHLPSNDEWQELVDFVGGDEVAGIKLKATSDWFNGTDGYGYSAVPGTDDYGFSALPGGSGSSRYGYSFGDVGNYGFWWSATEYLPDYYRGAYAYGRHMNFHDAEVFSHHYDTEFNLFSVRCVKD